MHCFPLQKYTFCHVLVKTMYEYLILAYQSSTCFTSWLQKQFMIKWGGEKEREREIERERERERVTFLVDTLSSINYLDSPFFCQIGQVYFLSNRYAFLRYTLKCAIVG